MCDLVYAKEMVKDDEDGAADASSESSTSSDSETSSESDGSSPEEDTPQIFLLQSKTIWRNNYPKRLSQVGEARLQRTIDGDVTYFPIAFGDDEVAELGGAFRDDEKNRSILMRLKAENRRRAVNFKLFMGVDEQDMREKKGMDDEPRIKGTGTIRERLLNFVIFCREDVEKRTGKPMSDGAYAKEMRFGTPAATSSPAPAPANPSIPTPRSSGRRSTAAKTDDAAYSAAPANVASSSLALLAVRRSYPPRLHLLSPRATAPQARQLGSLRPPRDSFSLDGNDDEKL